METLLTVFGFNKTLSGSRHDVDIDVISNYTPLAFVDEYGSTGVITRIIELMRFREMQPLFDTFEKNTGYALGNTYCTENELDLLAHRAIVLHGEINASLNGKKAKLKECEEELERIKRGEAGTRGDTVRAKAFKANEDKERLTSDISKTGSWCDFIAGILLLLNNEITAWEKGDYKRKQALPKITHSPVSEHYLRTTSKEASLFLDKIRALESAIKNINACFLTPAPLRFKTQKPTVLLNIDACRFYYSREGELMRQIMSREDYIQSVSTPMKKALQRCSEMQADINYTR